MKKVLVYFMMVLMVFVGFTACSDDVEVETNDCACCDLCTGTEDCTCGCGLCIYDTSSDTSGDDSSDTGDVVGGGSTGGTTGGSGSGSGTTTEEGTGSDTSDPSDDGDDQTPTVTDDYTIDEETGAYSIYTADGLAAWNEAVVAALEESGKSIDVTLMADINWNDLTSDYSWIPVGTTSRYEGTFDGNGYVISNIVINESTSALDSVGLFGNLNNGAVIKDLGLENVTVVGNSSTDVHVGAIAGDVTNSTIINCYVDGGSVTGAYYVGGIAGFVNSQSSIEASWTNVAVEATFGNLDAAGGIAGYSAGNIIACYTIADVKDLSGVAYLGGIIGYNAGTAISCYTTGSVEGVAGSTVGGVVGVNDGTLITCYYLETEDVIIVGGEYVTSLPIGQEGPNPERNGAAVTYAWNDTVLGYLNQGLTANEWNYSFTSASGDFPYVVG